MIRRSSFAHLAAIFTVAAAFVILAIMPALFDLHYDTLSLLFTQGAGVGLALGLGYLLLPLAGMEPPSWLGLRRFLGLYDLEEQKHDLAPRARLFDGFMNWRYRDTARSV